LSPNARRFCGGRWPTYHPAVPEPSYIAPPPREREMEFLGRLAQKALLGVRVLFWLTGAAALAGAIYITGNPTVTMSEDQPVPPLAQRLASNLTFLCFAIPLLLPVRWLLGRGRFVALALGGVMWFAPMLLPGDHAFGFAIRVFATLVACAMLLVWWTLWSLTRGVSE
jgi:hypothetical protein